LSKSGEHLLTGLARSSVSPKTGNMKEIAHSALYTPFEDLAFNAGGAPFIYEDDEVKSFHFTASAIQSSMRKKAPYELELSYTQTMMGFLLLQPEPRSIMIIGLGGGSLSKYCYRHIPDCKITTVEIDEGVISLRDDFKIPSDDERFSIVHAEGAEYITECRNSFDVIMVDGYDARGLPRKLCSNRFYDRCYHAIADQGILVVNLLKSESQLNIYRGRLAKAFSKRVLTVKAENDDNYIGFGLKLKRIPRQSDIQNQAVSLQHKYEIDFKTIASQMRRFRQLRRESGRTGKKFLPTDRNRLSRF
jgi:spermidine synthase